MLRIRHNLSSGVLGLSTEKAIRYNACVIHRRVRVTESSNSRSFSIENPSQQHGKFARYRGEVDRNRGIGDVSDFGNHPVPKTVQRDLASLQFALSTDDLAGIITHYPTARDNFLFGVADILNIAKVLSRTDGIHRRRKAVPVSVVEFTQDLINDIQELKIPTSSEINAIIISFCHSSGQLNVGSEFFHWLSHQSTELSDHKVYAGAILIATDQGKSASEIESLFQKAIERYPGTFLEYHLSNNALLATIGISNPAPDAPRPLIQAITISRLVRGETISAYMSLDTMLRISPRTTNANAVAKAIIVRPVQEAYLLFMTSCQFAKTSRADMLSELLYALRKSLIMPATMETFVPIIRSSLTAACAYLMSGQAPSVRHKNELIATITSIFSTTEVQSLAYEERQNVINYIVQILNSIDQQYGDFGIGDSVVGLEIILRVIGIRAGQNEVTLNMCKRLMEVGREKWKHSTYILLLEAAGISADLHAVRQFWSWIPDVEIQSDRKGHQTKLAFVLAAIRCNDLDFARQTLSKRMPVEELEAIVNQAMDKVYQTSTKQLDQSTSGTSSQVLVWMDQISKDVDAFQTLLTIKLAITPYTFPSSLIITQSSPQVLKIQEDTIYEFYRSVATEQSVKSDDGKSISDQSSAISLSPTNGIVSTGSDNAHSNAINIVDIRYANWRTINKLLSFADKYDKIKRNIITSRKIDRGENITVHERIDHAWKTLLHSEIQQGISVGLTDVLSRVKNEQKDNLSQQFWDSPVDDIEYIRRLRGLP